MSGRRQPILANFTCDKLTVSKEASYEDFIKGQANKICSDHLTPSEAASLLSWFLSQHTVTIKTRLN